MELNGVLSQCVNAPVKYHVFREGFKYFRFQKLLSSISQYFAVVYQLELSSDMTESQLQESGVWIYDFSKFRKLEYPVCSA